MGRLVDARQGGRLITGQVAERPCVTLGAADDEQQGKVHVLSAGHGAPLLDDVLQESRCSALIRVGLR
jgi:hypothetical protein